MWKSGIDPVINSDFRSAFKLKSRIRFVGYLLLEAIPLHQPTMRMPRCVSAVIATKLHLRLDEAISI